MGVFSPALLGGVWGVYLTNALYQLVDGVVFAQRVHNVIQVHLHVGVGVRAREEKRREREERERKREEKRREEKRRERERRMGRGSGARRAWRSPEHISWRAG